MNYYNEMIHYKHYSFDLWMTLIKSNPSFKKLRADFFFTNFNPLKKNIDEVLHVFRHVDLMCNAINEKTGGNIDAEEMYLMVIYQLSGNTEGLKDVNLTVLYNQMEQLVFENMPLVYNAETIDILTEIKAESEITLNVLSNTAFIKGSTMRNVLQHLQIGDFFDFQFYSDELGISKPHSKIFEVTFDKIRLIRKEPILPREVIHIGDNPIADIAAANTFGMGSFQINSNNKLITDLLK